MKTLFRFAVLLIVGGLTALRAEKVDILFCAAAETDLQPLRAKLDGVHTVQVAAWTFYVGQWEGHPIALAQTEPGPLNAVASATLGIRHFQPALVVTFGIARAHDPALAVGDVVLAKKFAAFDGMLSPHKELGEGSDALQWEKLDHLLINPGEKEMPADFFPADLSALAAAQSLAASLGKCVPGVLGSAFQVNREIDRIAWLRKTWDTSCEDGESAHIAGAAALLKIPVFGFRIISEGLPSSAATPASADYTKQEIDWILAWMRAWEKNRGAKR